MLVFQSNIYVYKKFENEKILQNLVVIYKDFIGNEIMHEDFRLYN